MGRLLHDKTLINKIPGYSTVADLVRMEVLGRFIHECINWLEHAEREEKEGLISDDRFAKGVQNVSVSSFVVGSIADLFCVLCVCIIVVQVLQLAHQTPNHRCFFRHRHSRNDALYSSILAFRRSQCTLSTFS